MSFPDFFEQAPVLRLRDPLAELLGAAEGGLVDYRYADAVRLAGHSCPTVAGSWGLARRALLALYGDELPVRGDILIDSAAPADRGVTGVVAAVFGLITGAAGEGGFQGLGGQHVRRNLLRFGVALPLAWRFSRRDGGAVDAAVDLSSVPGSPEIGALLPACLAGAADAATRRRFGELWQARVRAILLDHRDDPAVFIVRRV